MDKKDEQRKNNVAIKTPESPGSFTLNGNKWIPGDEGTKKKVSIFKREFGDKAASNIHIKQKDTK